MSFEYIFGGNTGETPESLARKQEIRDAIAARVLGNQPTTALGGIGSIIAGLGMGYGRWKDNQAEKAGRKSADSLFSSLFSGNQTSTAPTTQTLPDNTSVSKAPTKVPGTMENARTADRNSVQSYAGMDLKSGIRSAADALGIDPADLATAISYETAGTFDPLKPGPTTQWGRHRGLIQFGEPQAKQYGVNWNDPINSQLGPEGAVVKYLRDAGVKPGMGLEDIYSAINAGKVGRYNASDADNGGAPGTVADKVASMGPFRQKALALLGTQQPSEDAQSTMAAMMADPRGRQPVQADQPVQVADNSNTLPAQTQQVAQNVQQPQQTVQQPRSALAGVDPKLIQAMSNPWLSPAQRAGIQMLIKQQMDQAEAAREDQTWKQHTDYEQQLRVNDPAYKLGLEKGQLELDALKHPHPEYDFVNGKDGSVFRVDKRTGTMETVYGPQEQVPDAIKALRLRAAAAGLKEGTPEYQKFMLLGGQNVDDTPDAIKTLNARADAAGLKPGSPERAQFMLNGGSVNKAPTDVQEYEYAKNQGYTGTFQQWQLENKRASAANVNIDQKAESAFDKKLAEKQADIFSTMSTEGMNAKSDLAVINQLDDLMKGQGGTLTGLSGKLAQWGIPFSGADDLQAANALIAKLIPSQRQPGSGTMSDRDVEMFRASLPSLWNTPGGNTTIINVMRGLADYKQRQGEIADMVMEGEISRQEGRRMLRQLPNPLADFDKLAKQKQDGQDAVKKDTTTPADNQNYDPNLPFWAKPKKPVVINGYTIEEVH